MMLSTSLPLPLHASVPKSLPVLPNPNSASAKSSSKIYRLFACICPCFAKRECSQVQDASYLNKHVLQAPALVSIEELNDDEKIKSLYVTDRSTHHLITRHEHKDSGVTEETLKQVREIAHQHFSEANQDFFFEKVEGLFIAKKAPSGVRIVKYNELIGQGGFGFIHQVFDFNTGRALALKEARIPEDHANQKKIEGELENEEHILLKIKNQRLLLGVASEIHDVFNVPSPYGNKKFIMVDLFDGDYFALLRARSKDINDDTDITDSIKEGYQVIVGLKALEDLNILHLDIKPSNILVKIENGGVKLTLSDFGGAIDLDSISPDLLMGTPITFTPECSAHEDLEWAATLRAEYRRSKKEMVPGKTSELVEQFILLLKKIMIFQTGILLHKVFTISNASPFPLKFVGSTLTQVPNLDAPYLELTRTMAPAPISRIIKQSLSKNHLERPTLCEILKFFEQQMEL
jgi:hypothetical protein